MNTPLHASDDQINALHELEHEAIYLRSVPAEDWHFDVNDEGAPVATCPRCAYRGAPLSTRDERIQCCECGHVDGTQYVRIGRTQDDPGELVDVRHSDPDQADEVTL